METGITQSKPYPTAKAAFVGRAGHKGPVGNVKKNAWGQWIYEIKVNL